MTFFDRCMVVVLKVHALAGKFDGAKMYLGSSAVRTATEALTYGIDVNMVVS